MIFTFSEYGDTQAMIEPMTDFVKLVLTSQDKQALELLAKHEDRSMSSTVRKLIRDEVRRLRLQTTDDYAETPFPS